MYLDSQTRKEFTDYAHSLPNQRLVGMPR